MKHKLPRKPKDLFRLKKLGLAFLITAIAVFVYIKVQPHTQAAKQERQLETKSQQLKDTIKTLEQQKSQDQKTQDQLKQTQQQLQDTQKQLESKRNAATAYAAEAPPQAYTATAPTYSGSHEDWMAQAGIAASDYGYVQYIVDREGHWDPCVWNGGHSECNYGYGGDYRAYGVCQALPGSKMASAGADWLTNPVTQLKWCASYANARYGGWYGSYLYWTVYHLW